MRGEREGRGYDRVIVAESKDVGAALARLRVGEWSPIVKRVFQSADGPKTASFRFKLLTLTPDAGAFRLLVTPISAHEGWTEPPERAPILSELGEVPPPLEEAYVGYRLRWYGEETLIEMFQAHSRFLGDMATYLLKHKPWDLFAMHNHIPDMVYHLWSNSLDPLYSDAETVKEFEAIEVAIFKGIDAMVGRILKYADADTVVVFVFDHGAKPTGRPIRPMGILARAGLTSVEVNPRATATGLEGPAGAGITVDWSKTKAFPQRSVYVYINLKGRDPDGIVEPEDYEKVQEEIIDALLSAKDPDGKRQIAVALKKEDARFIGHWGPYVGDVVFAMNPEYWEQHAPFLPSVRHGIGSLRAMLLFTGAGIKKGITLERNVWIQDVVPTICYLTGWPVPEQCEGAVVYQALANRDR